MSFALGSGGCSRCAKILTSSSRSKRSFTAPVEPSNFRHYSRPVAVENGRPFRMAVIGSGPAGFYTAYRVMSKIPNAKVDMYEHLPVPFGLVRFGVAPDHPEVKNCQDKFKEVAQSPNFNFIGNVAIGNGASALPLETLVPYYDAILFAYGASKDRTLGIQGEDQAKGVYSARAFVGWYNGLPEYADLAPDLSLGSEAIVVGQGNVALDVARILLSDLEVLRKTDITGSAVDALSKSRIKTVRLVGRRGPMQAAFTIKEVRELMNLDSVAFQPIETSLIPPDIAKLPRAPKRIMQVLSKGSAAQEASADRSWSLDFRLSPVAFNTNAASNLTSMSFQRTSLSPDVFDPHAQATGIGDFIDIPASLAFRSIGYKSEGIQGFDDLGIPFDDKLGIIPNDQYGRIMRPSDIPGDPLTSRHVPGMYCAGWVKRGPTGVIASTMNDAFSTADIVAEDWNSGASFLRSVNDTADNESAAGWHAVKEEAKSRGCRRVSWRDWEKIDQAEIERGRENGKEREKFTRVADMLAVLD